MERGVASLLARAHMVGEQRGEHGRYAGSTDFVHGREVERLHYAGFLCMQLGQSYWSRCFFLPSALCPVVA